MKHRTLNIIATFLLLTLNALCASAQTDNDSIWSAQTDSLSIMTDEELQAFLDSVFLATYPVLEDVHADPEELPDDDSITDLSSFTPSFTPIDLTKAVGEIPFESGVSPTGAKTYNVPINLFHPDGVFAPQLSFAYNSQQGNGTLGVGWSVGGLQAITRGNKSIYYDNATSGVKMDENDALYLNGTRLILLSSNSTEKLYETETGHIKVVGYLSSHVLKYFKVYYPNGYQGTFGYTNNTTNKLTYPLTVLTDDKGNTINYDYSFVNNIYAISYISYGIGGLVMFEYNTSPRPDAMISFRNGLTMTEYRRLQSVKCYYGVSQMNEYTLTYSAPDSVSLLTKIDYSANGSSLNPLQFYYGTDASDGFKVSTAQFSDGISFSNSNEIVALRGRFDYSSADDGIISYQNCNPYHYRYDLFFRGFQNDYNSSNVNTTIYLYPHLSNNYIGPTPSLSIGTGFIRMLCADLEGKQEEYPIKINNVVDGDDDKVTFSVYKKSSIGYHTLSYTRNFSFPTVCNLSGFKSIQPKDYFVGDFNGDGKTEVLAMSAHNPLGGTTRPSMCYIFDLENNQLLMNTHIFDYIKEYISPGPSNPSDFLEAFDYDGDGKTDLCHISASGIKFYSFEDTTGGMTFTANPLTYTDLNKSSFSNRRILFGDFNGDGLVDILKSPEESSGPNGSPYWYVYFNKGDGNFLNPNSFTGPTNTSDKRFLIQDIDNDGTSDLICQDGDTMTFYRIWNGGNIGTSTQTLQDENCILVPVRLSASTTSNVLVSFKNTNVRKISYKKNARNELLATGMMNSLGVTQQNTYYVISQTPMTGVYTLGTTYTFPYIRLMEPIAVLAESKSYLNSTLIDENHYYYTDAVFHRQGLGFCGFAKIIADNFKGMSTTTIYDPLHFGNVLSMVSPANSAAYTYSNTVQSNRLRSSNLVTATETDRLKNVTWTTSYSYNTYDYPTTVTKSSTGYTITKQYAYNPLTNISQRYQLDLLDSESETVTKGNTSFTTSTTVTARNSSYLPTAIVKSINGNTAEQITKDYNNIGQVTSQAVKKFSSNNWLTVTNTYNGYKLLASTTDALGNTVSYTYDSYNNPVTKTDNTGTTTYTYDAFGRVVSEQLPQGTVNTTTYGWSSINSLARYSVTKASNASPTAITVYDALSREIRSSQQLYNGTYVHRDREYDTYGRLSRESQPYTTSSAAAWNTYSYDVHDRVTQFAEALNKTITYAYSDNTITESNGQNTATKYHDAMGRLTQITDNAGTTSYTLHANGSPLSINVLGKTVTFTYDGYGRRTAMSDPSHGTTSYVYDNSGNTAQVTDANGNTTQMTYDQYGRMTTKVNDEFTSTYTYNNTFNKLASVSSTNSTAKNYTYDNYGRLSVSKEYATSSIWFQQTHTFDSTGKLASTAYASNRDTLGTEHFIYSNQTLSQVNWGTTTIFQLTGVGAQGLPSSVSTGPLTRSYSYNAAGKPTLRVAGTGQATLMNMSYSYNNTTGNMASRTNYMASLSESFSYDTLDRLTSYGGISVSYDNYGNITSKGDVGTYGYNRTDKPFAVTDVTLTDNTLSSLNDQTVSYTSFNRLYEIEEGDITATFTYNDNYERVRMHLTTDDNIGPMSPMGDGGQGRFQSILMTRYYLGGRYEYETSMSGWQERLYLNGDYYSATAVYTKEQIHVLKGDSDKGGIVGPGLPIAKTLRYIVRDHLGSITHVVSSTGTVLQELSYDAWGRLRNPQTYQVYAPGSEPTLVLGRGYCGHEHIQQFGLINMNARLYDPVLGRFLSPDPYVQMPDFAQNYNRYSYCMNSPLMYVDKDGKFIFSLLTCLYDLGKNIIKHGFNVSQYNWDKTINAWRIDIGMFRGNIGQIINKWTWNLTQSLIGNITAHGFNLLGGIENVSYMDGLLALSGATGKKQYDNGDFNPKAFTIGHYSFGPKGYQATWKDHLFVHEYGHYIQSQLFGPSYLPIIGIPSFLSNTHLLGNSHSTRWFEVDANKRGANHFDKKYGRGKDGYIYKDENYFDRDSFENYVISPYVNPRTGTTNQVESYNTSGARFNILDLFLFF